MSILACLMLIAGCGGDATGAELNVPTYPNVAGAWSYDPCYLSGGGREVSITSGTLSLTHQTDSTFTGTFTGGVLHWPGYSLGSGSGTVVNGSVDESGAITFDFHLSAEFDTPDWQFTGTVSGESASGTVVVTLDHGGPIGVITYEGSWAMRR